MSEQEKKEEQDNLRKNEQEQISEAQKQEKQAEPISEKAVKIQDAKKLLREVDDKVGRFIRRRGEDIDKGRSKNGNDW